MGEQPIILRPGQSLYAPVGVHSRGVVFRSGGIADAIRRACLRFLFPPTVNAASPEFKRFWLGAARSTETL